VDLDECIFKIATRQRPRVRMPISLAQLAGQHGLPAKLRTFWSRVFLPKNMLADAYNVRRSSRLIYAVYAIRLKDIVKRHWRTAIHIHRGNPALTSLASDTMALQKFLVEEQGPS
jgi:hypothetical protein